MKTKKGKHKTPIVQQAFIWNMIGGFCNSITSFLLLLFVTRILGSSEAGIFAFAFANAQLMLTIGKYGMRAYQATDIQSIVPFEDYLFSRVITCFFMILGTIVYVLWNGYTVQKIWIIILVCLIKVSDAIEDVFHGQLQRIYRLDIAGKLLTARNAATIFIFLITLLLSNDLLNTCFATAWLSIIITIILNVKFTSKNYKLECKIHPDKLIKVFKDCLPLFIGSFLSLYIYNAPKNAIDSYLPYEFQTYYSILFMPAFVINLFSEFAFKPLLTHMAILWDDNRIKDFFKVVYSLLIIIMGLTVLTISFAYFLGIPVLSFVYDVSLNPYRVDLLILLSGGGFGAAVYFLYNILTSMRKQKIILLGYAIIAGMITLLAPILVKKASIRGAALSYLISIAILFIFFFISLIVTVFRKGSKNVQ